MMPNTAPPTEHWQDHAACSGTNTELFFLTIDRYGTDVDDPALIEAAKTVCRRCEVREECLTAALDNEEWGVWGETTQDERERLNRLIPRAKCPICACTDLHASGRVQICNSCGQSWTTGRTPHRRTNTDVAA